MQEAVPEWAISLIEMVFRVEGVQTVPAELILTLGALHEFAAACPHNAYLARRTNLREEYLVEIAV